MARKPGVVTGALCDVCHVLGSPDNAVTAIVDRGLALVVCRLCAERGLKPTCAHRVRHTPTPRQPRSPTMTKHSSIEDAQNALGEFEAAVRSLPTASVHDIGPITALLGQLHSVLDNVITPLVVHPAHADPRVLNGTDA